MMKFFTLLSAFLYLLLVNATAQNCPPNIDFENGDFSNWQCFTGFTYVGASGQNVIDLSPSAPISDRHELISSATAQPLDYYGNFPKLCPYGGNYSVKLGNDGMGAQAEGMSYTFQIPPTQDTFSFTYFYAVVFENPGHAVVEQPRFFVTAYDVATGALINCASYNYVSTGSIPGFQLSALGSDVLYKDWSPVSIQFAGLQGHTVRLEFKTADCTLSGHFGYAYLDVSTGCSNILATAPYCAETNSLILNAPFGFQNYVWFNEDYSAIIGNQQSITLSPPPAITGTFHVDVIPYPGYGCRDTVDAVVLPLPVPDMPVAPVFTFCQFSNASPLTAVASQNCSLLWYSSLTGGTGSVNPPSPNTNVAGTFFYYVSQKRLFGCESFRKKITVNVVPTAQASFNINAGRQCLKNNSFTFTSTSTNLANPSYSWDFGDGQTLSAPAPAMVTHVYSAAGTYTVKLRTSNAGTCYTEKLLQVVVVPKPVADFNFPPLICEGQTPVTLTNSSSTPGVPATINQWWWNLNGVVSTLSVPAPFTTNLGGQYPVRLVVTTTEGCVSDTASKTIPVRYRPLASFSVSDPLCENVVSRFTNTSSLPAAAAPEYIKDLYWQFDNATNMTGQEPAINLNANSHAVLLIAETDYGCKSVPLVKNIIVHPKPRITLTISDSCVRRSIAYKAADSTGSGTVWYWNFGSGVQQLNNVVYKNYSFAFSNSITLKARNSFGCEETHTRPFTIFKNNAVAGRDTITAIDEPVQLNAAGDSGCKYLWTPQTGLNNNAIGNPIATYDRDQLYYLDATTKEGCDSRSRILIKRFKGPELYIPSAFTPNGDGYNDYLKVFPAGIKSFDYFAVYNRFGQQVFYTKDFSKGWDGTFKGSKLDPGAYVAMAKAVDYKGRVMFQKLSVLLLR